MTIELGHQDDLGARLAELERKLQYMSTQDMLQNASIGAGGLTVEGAGGITVTGGGVIVVNGATLSAVTPGYNLSGLHQGFAIGTNATATPQATCTLTAPTGYSKVQIQTFVTSSGLNSTGASDYLKNSILINGGLSLITNSTATAAPGATASVLDVGIAVLTGLTTGQTITVDSAPYTGTGWAANAGNSTGLIVSQLWFQ